MNGAVGVDLNWSLVTCEVFQIRSVWPRNEWVKPCRCICSEWWCLYWFWPCRRVWSWKKANVLDPYLGLGQIKFPMHLNGAIESDLGNFEIFESRKFGLVKSGWPIYWLINVFFPRMIWKKGQYVEFLALPPRMVLKEGKCTRSVPWFRANNFSHAFEWGDRVRSWKFWNFR